MNDFIHDASFETPAGSFTMQIDWTQIFYNNNIYLFFFIVSSIGKYAGIKSYNETKALHWDRFRIWYYRFRQNKGKKNVIDIQVFDYLLINFEWIENI